MGCCSGQNQTTRLAVTLFIRPTPDRQFPLNIILSGSGGKWVGRFEKVLNFGDRGVNKPLGKQNLLIIMTLRCAEGNTLQLSGEMDVTLAAVENNISIRPTELECKNGPMCYAEWADLFLGEFMGNATMTVRGNG